MRASAVIEVVRRDGRDVLQRVRSEPPLSLRGTTALLHLVGSGAGPLGGDDLVLRIRVGAGASLTVASVAASMVLPGVSGAVSRYRLDAEVDDGGHLTFLPEPQILVRGCDHEMRTTIRLGEGATLRWRDETVLGRHQEVSGSLLHRVRIDRAGRPLLRTDLAVGPRWPESEGPGGLHGAKATGTVLEVGNLRAEVAENRNQDPQVGDAAGNLRAEVAENRNQDPQVGDAPGNLRAEVAENSNQDPQVAMGWGPSARDRVRSVAPDATSEAVRGERLVLADGSVLTSAVGDSARAVRAVLDGPARALVRGS